mmetsp:Transcript_51169/g.112122  ORF Transcript_51169/g.112122 Transcript_51169/m.112122 type:complete len:470 (-) Transcript_51169:13-1422(-)
MGIKLLLRRLHVGCGLSELLLRFLTLLTQILRRILLLGLQLGQLLLQLLQQPRDLISGQRRVQLHRAEQVQCFKLVLELALVLLLPSRVGRLPLLGLLALHDHPQRIVILLLHQHLRPLRHFELRVRLLLLLLLLGLHQTLAIGHHLAHQVDLILEWKVLLTVLGLALQLGLLPLSVLHIALHLLLLPPSLLLLLELGVELALGSVELVTLRVALANLRAKLLRDSLTLVEKLRHVTLLRPTLLNQLVAALLHLSALIAKCIDLLVQLRSTCTHLSDPGSVEGLDLGLLVGVHGELRLALPELRDLCDVLLLLLQRQSLGPHLVFNVGDGIIDLLHAVESKALLHVVQLALHVLALVLGGLDLVEDGVLLSHESTDLLLQLIHASGELILLALELLLATHASLDLLRQLLLLLLQSFDVRLVLGHIFVEGIAIGLLDLLLNLGGGRLRGHGSCSEAHRHKQPVIDLSQG